MKKHYALTLFLAAIIIVAFAAVAGSGSTSDLPNPPAIGPAEPEGEETQ